MPKAKKAANPRANGAIDKEIGVRMRAIRMDKKLSQDELGRSLGVSFQQIQKYEKGVNRISAARLIQVSHALTTTPHHLIGWDAPARTDGAMFDNEAYKLAKLFVQLPDKVKRQVRALISVIIGDDDE